MDLAELTVSRRTVHSFKAEKVADNVVERALELSLWAPNHKRTFPWSYYWIGPEARRKLADLSVELKSAKKSISETEKQALRDSVLHPSHVIALGIRRGEDEHRMHEDYATLACSVQIASLYLWEQGVSSKWSTGGFALHPRTYEILGVSSKEVQLEGALLIGVPLIVPAPAARPSLGTVLKKIT